MTDPFDSPIGSIAVPVSIRLPTEKEPDVFFDGDRFLSYVAKTYDFVDVATYSLSKSEDAPLPNVRRLITNLPMPSRSGLRPQAMRVAVNNHTKIFLCYRNVVPAAVYIGSQNLTFGTQINLMYKVAECHVDLFVDFFERLWKRSHPLYDNIIATVPTGGRGVESKELPEQPAIPPTPRSDGGD